MRTLLPRRHPGRLVVVLALIVAAAGFDAGSDAAKAADASVVEVGWWSRTPGTTTPEGGFQVAKDLSGETSVTAVRIQYEGPLTRALLILTEATSGYLKEGAVVEACPTTAEWTAAVAGPLEQAPAADCATKIPLERDGVTGSWRADVTNLLTGDAGTISLVLKPGVATTVTPPAPPSVPSPVPLVPLPTPPAVPVPPVETPVDPGYSVDFVRASLQATGNVDDEFGGGFDSSDASGSIASDFGGTTGSSGGSSSSFAPTFVPSDTFASSSSASLTPRRDVLPSATPDVAAGGAGGVGTASSVESGLQPVAASRGPATPWGRLLLLVPLSLLVGAVGSFARRTWSGARVAAG